MTEIDRRSALLTLFGGFAAGSPPAPAQAASFSPEYWECERLWVAKLRQEFSQTASHREQTETEIIAEIQATDAYRAAKEALLRRPVRTWWDVVALMRTEAWQSGEFISARYRIGDNGVALKAAHLLIGRGWEVPQDLVQLDDERERQRQAHRVKLPRRDDSDL